jgi:FixJ family two-component response regulator
MENDQPKLLANLTLREHAILRIIVAGLNRTEVPKQNKEHHEREDTDPSKSRPAPKR